MTTKSATYAANTQAYTTQQRLKKADSVPNTYTWWHWVIPPAFLACITFLVYLPSLRYEFVFDDLSNIVKYYAVRHKTLSDLFFANTRWISYWLNTQYYKIAQFNPFIYRLGNVCFHTITGILIFITFFMLLKNLSPSNWIRKYAFSTAFITCMLFMLHPVQTQTVAYAIQGQLEGLAALGIIIMLFFFTAYAYAQTTISKSMYCLLLFIATFFTCGTKEIAIISPGLLLITDWFFIAQGSLQSLKQRLLLHLTVFSTVFGIYLYFLKPAFFTTILSLKASAQNNIGNSITLQGDTVEPIAYALSQFKVIVHYMSIFIWPFNLCADYDWKLVSGFLAYDCFVPFLLLIFLVIYLSKRLYTNNADLLSFGVIWFFICILPRSSIVASSELLADYKTYTGSIGFLFLLSLLLVFFAIYLEKIFYKTNQNSDTHSSFDNPGPYTYAALLTIFLSINGYMTFARTQVWSSSENFWHDVIQKAPKKARAYNNYGVALINNHKEKQALTYLKKALSIDPHYPDPWNNRAVIYAVQNKIDKAIFALQQSLHIYPYQPEAYNNLGSYHLEQKAYDKSKKCFKAALTLRPHYGKALYNIGRLYLALNKHEKAYKAFKQACTQADFDNELGFKSYAHISARLHKYDEALEAYTKAYSYNPNDPYIMLGLATAYAGCKHYDKALEIYKQLHYILPNVVQVWFNSGEVYALNHNYAQAFDCFTKAQHLDTHNQFPQIALSLAGCLERLGQPQKAKTILQKALTQKLPPELEARTRQALSAY